MKKYVLLLCATMCSASVFAAELTQCKNCGRHFEGDSQIGYDYCRKNSCQKVRHNEKGKKFRSELNSEMQYYKGLNDTAKFFNTIGEAFITAQKEKKSVKEQVNFIEALRKQKRFTYAYLWRQVIAYASIDVIKACWPMADTDDLLRKSSAAEANTRPPLIGMMYSDQLSPVEKSVLRAATSLPIFAEETVNRLVCYQSNKSIGCAFALGKHQKTGETRYVEKLNCNSFQYLIWAAQTGRIDVLEWFFKQMDGVDVDTLCVFNSAFGKFMVNFNEKRLELESNVKKLQAQKENAADKLQEKEFDKKIADVKKEIAKIPAKPIDDFDAVIKFVLKNTSDKVLDEFVAIADKDYTSSRDNDLKIFQKLTCDILKMDSRGKQKIEIYNVLGRFVWKPGLPNLKKVGVVAGEKVNTWVASPGFVMQKDGSAKWTPGLKHPECEKTVAGKEMFTWVPDEESIWYYSGEPNDLRSASPFEVFLVNGSNRR